MAHSHTHTGTFQYNKAFLIGIGLNAIYIIIELVYGLMTDSLALIADAGHNISDVLGLILAWAAGYLVTRKATENRTYGYRKTSILAAFLNALILMIAIGGIIWEAIGRVGNPQPVQSNVIMIVAGIGVLINAATALLFFGGRKKDLNIKGAFLHMAADAAVSLGVVAGGFLILKTDWLWVDPVLSIIIALVIFIGTWNLLKDSFHLAIDAVPPHIEQQDILSYFENLPGVENVHDLHIWAMSTTETALTVHLVIPDAKREDVFLEKVAHDLLNSFNIEHPTIQIESKKEKNCKDLKV